MNAVSLTIIGCGDAFGSGGQLNTCFYIKSQALQLLVDCGATSLPALKRNRIAASQIDLIVLTHFHGDHFGGVPFLLLELATYGQIKPLTIISPPGCKERLEQLLGFLYPGSVVLGKLDITFISSHGHDHIINQHIRLHSFPMKHTTQTLPHGVRLTLGNKVISYSGDTEWTDNLIALADQADIFICECNFYQRQVKGHLNYTTIQQKLQFLTSKKILLTHFGAEMLASLQHISLDYATEGRTIELH